MTKNHSSYECKALKPKDKKRDENNNIQEAKKAI